ncbi:hypothetical protein Purlil1_4050 [Purpureocillium lilacinum]|uniref:NmrA-like domain-containing protein n=1 Tax=Purpureocillium lilacinum TaxID=33203 RepID=A0ABR0C5X2_PURLI|nr:hypothetical protein Purlil1_4050 [Purpureocillium lilacinum]
MHVTIAPASTRTAAAVIRSLLAEAPDTVDIHALYRNLARVPKEFADKPNFHALQGDVSDPTTLDFTGSDAVLAITPPTFEGGDIVKQAEILSKNIKDAIEAAGSVKRLVLLSSVGAQLREGVGEIKTNNAAERVLATTNVPSITFVRCAYFMENWTMGMDTLKAPEPFFFSTITPLDWKVPMVAVADIGSTLAAELLKEEPAPSKPHIYELHGPRRYTPLDVQAAFSKAVGKQVAVKPVEKSELHGFYSQVFPPEIVGEWVEMSTSFLEGGVMAADKVDYSNVNVVNGRTELDEALGKAYAQAANHAASSTTNTAAFELGYRRATPSRSFPLTAGLVHCDCRPQCAEWRRGRAGAEVGGSEPAMAERPEESHKAEPLAMSERARCLAAAGAAGASGQAMGGPACRSRGFPDRAQMARSEQAFGGLGRHGHVNNVIYNRFAESARVNWITSYAATAEPAQRQQWDELMTPRSIGLILRSIKTDYKLVSGGLGHTKHKLANDTDASSTQPITYPDQVTVIHKLSVKPDYGADSVILEAVILSEQHKRIAARCFEDIAVYDYQAAKRAPLKDFMVDELRKVYDLQEKNKAEMDKLAAAIDEAVGA